MVAAKCLVELIELRDCSSSLIFSYNLLLMSL